MSLLLQECNALLPLEGRLANRLLLLSEGGEHGQRLTLRLSQEDLSQMLGSSRQSINKVLKDWDLQGIVSRNYGSLTLCDITSLRRLASPQ
ncbi:cAMP receptor protein [compost metagenome]